MSSGKHSTHTQKQGRVMVLDATAFYAGIPLLSSSSRYYTTSLIMKEVRHIKQSIDAMDILVEAGNLTVLDPDQEHLREARAYAERVGEHHHLSDADISLIALALMLRSSSSDVTVVTDDYSIANIARVIGLDVSYIISKGIRHTGYWLRYCKICRLTYTDASTVCKICGNRLRYKLVSSNYSSNS